MKWQHLVKNNEFLVTTTLTSPKSMLTVVTLATTSSSSSHQPLQLEPQAQPPPCFTLSHLTVLITNNAELGRKKRRELEGKMGRRD
jgi:hypothetical protein